MRDKDFDKIFKAKLEGKKVEFDPEHWTKMETALDEIDVPTSETDDHFDQQIKEKIDAQLSNYQNDHWNQLEYRLNNSAALKTKIFFSKVTEISILLLLVFTFFNLNLDQKYNRQKRSSVISPEAIASVSQISHIQKADQVLLYASTSLRESNINPYLQVGGLEPRDDKEKLNDNLTKLNLALESSKEDLNPIKAEITSQMLYQAAPIALLDIDPIDKHATAPLLSALPIIEPAKNKNKKGTWYLNAYGSADVNYINSPLDKTFFTPSYTVETIGSTAGIGISYRKGIAEIGIGANYSTKSYKPRHTKEIIGSFLDGYELNSLDHILFNIVSTPVSLKLHHFNSEKWSVYSCLGLAPNLIINAHYSRTEKLIPGASSNNVRSFSSKFEEKSFNDGILEGGNLLDNIYLSSIGGAGVQYTPIKELSLYLQPSYSIHVLSPGIGPNDDKLYNFSLEIGAKYRLF